MWWVWDSHIVNRMLIIWRLQFLATNSRFYDILATFDKPHGIFYEKKLFGDVLLDKKTTIYCIFYPKISVQTLGNSLAKCERKVLRFKKFTLRLFKILVSDIFIPRIL